MVRKRRGASCEAIEGLEISRIVVRAWILSGRPLGLLTVDGDREEVRHWWAQIIARGEPLFLAAIARVYGRVSMSDCFGTLFWMTRLFAALQTRR